MDSLADILPALVRETEDSSRARESAVFAAWSAAVGANVRRVCVPERLDGRRLLVCTVDQTWRTQLGRLSEKFVFKINSLLGAPLIARVQFRVDPDRVAAYASRADTSPTANTSPSSETLDASLMSQAEVIDDPVLRATFLRAASRCLSRIEKEDSDS